MRRNLLCGSLLSVVLAAFAAAQTTNPTRTATAKTAAATTTPAISSSPTTGSIGHGAHGQLRASLHWAHKLLVEADHDYDGHRARAAHEVHRALEELDGHHHPKTTVTSGAVASATAPSVRRTAASSAINTGKSVAPSVHRAVAASPVNTGKSVAPQTTAPTGHAGTAATAAHHEPQAISDAQLRKAREILRMAAAETRAHHPHAHGHVVEAIAEIDRALAIK